MTKECSMCGECCKVIPLNARTLTKEGIEYFLAKGLVWDRVQGFILIPHTCVHLTDQNRCSIQDNKPIVCKKYHGKKRGAGGVLYYIPPGCTMR